MMLPPNEREALSVKPDVPYLANERVYLRRLAAADIACAGTCGFYRGFTNGTGEIGYVLREPLRGRGIMTDAVRAALVIVGDEAIAWANYGTIDELPHIQHRKQYLAEADLIPDFRVTCIFVDKRFRGQGYAKVALAGALEQIAALGGGIVEGYPHEVPQGW